MHHRVLKSSLGFPRETYLGVSFFSSARLKKSESFLTVRPGRQTGSEARHKYDAEAREPAGPRRDIRLPLVLGQHPGSESQRAWGAGQVPRIPGIGPLLGETEGAYVELPEAGVLGMWVQTEPTGSW